MKLKPFLPILISGAVFIVFLLLPASWFTGLVNEKTVEDNRNSIDRSSTKRHTHSR